MNGVEESRSETESGLTWLTSSALLVGWFNVNSVPYLASACVETPILHFLLEEDPITL